MKVLVIFNSSYPVGAVSTHRIHNICKGLVENGADLQLLIVHATERYDNIINNDLKGSCEGVNYNYVSKKTYREKNIIFRKLNDFICHLKVLYFILINKYNSDITLVTGTSFDYRLFLPVAAFFTKTKIVLEINEFLFVGKKNTRFVRIKRWLIFNLIFPLYDGFIVISEGLLRNVDLYKNKRAEIIKVPILSESKNGSKELGPRPISDPYIIHAGSFIEEKDGILGVLTAFGIAVKNSAIPVKYVFTGNPGNSQHAVEIENIIRKYDLSERVLFVGYLSEIQLINYFEHASLAIVNKYDSIQNRFCFATKLADYISYGIPVITTTVGESNYFLKDGFNSVLVEPGKHELLAKKIVFALNNPSIMSQLSVNAGLLMKKEFNYKYQGARMYSYYDKLIRK